MNVLTLDIIKVLFLRFTSIFGDRFKKNHESPEMFDMWCQDWFDGLAGILPEHIKQALEHCKLNLEWAPSIAEFRGICEKYSGLPSVNEAIALAIRGDFTHPIVKRIYDQVGSWNMKNMTEKDLLKRFSVVYKEEVAHLRMVLYKQHRLENDSKLTELKGISDDKSRDRARIRGVQKITEDLFSFG